MRSKLCDITHNAYIKTYPNGIKTVMISDYQIFRESGWELSNKWDSEERYPSEHPDEVGNVARAKRRARSAVADLAMSNDFRYFVTLTLDPSRVNRYDPAEVVRRLNNWLDNHVRRDGLAYVLVPEYAQGRSYSFPWVFQWCSGGRGQRNA
jgi:hypothetical protein